MSITEILGSTNLGDIFYTHKCYIKNATPKIVRQNDTVK
jgi:hypothetical protein